MVSTETQPTKFSRLLGLHRYWCRKALTLCSVISGVLLVVYTGWAFLALNIGVIAVAKIKMVSVFPEERMLSDTYWWLQQAKDSSSTESRAFWGLGLLWGKMGMIDQAQTALEQARRLNPANPFVHLELGDLYSQTGNITGALAEYAIIEYHLREHLAVADFLDLLDDKDISRSEKRHILNQVLKLDPRNIIAAYGLFGLLDESGSGSEAELIEKIRRFSMNQIYQPGDVGKRMSVHLARVVPEIVDDGIWDLELALRVADWWRRVENYEAAEILLTKLLDHYPSNLSVQEQLAQVLNDSGDWGKAIEVARNVLKFNPDSESAYRSLIGSYEALGDIAKANTWRKQYYKVAPDDWWDRDVSLEQYRHTITNIVADLIKIPPSRVTLTSNELPSEISMDSSHWRFEVWTPDGAYGGMENIRNSITTLNMLPYSRQSVATVCGFWRGDAYAGIKLQGSPEWSAGNATYVLSFLYRVDGNQRYQWETHGGPFDTKMWLSPSNGQWRLFVAIASVSGALITQTPLMVTNGGLGCLDVADVEIRRLLSPDISLLDGENHFTIRGYSSVY